MDLFEIPDDYVPEKPLTSDQMDQITQYLTSHPLFMKQVPKNIEDNQHLSALQNIIYDEQPDVVAFNLNKQGNQRLQLNPNHLFYMRDAYKKYTEGINIKGTNAQTNAKLHSNRAMINLKLKNYGKVIEDCQAAIKYNPQFVKAYYRYAQALIGLQKYQQAVNLLEPRSQPELKQQLKKAQQGVKKINKQKQQKQTLIDNKVTQLSKYCKQRGWRMKKRTQPIPGNTKLQFIDNKIVIPTLILYPEFSQFDLVQKITQDCIISNSINEVVNDLPWDADHLYNPSSIQMYVELSPHTMLKLKPQTSVNQLLKVYEFPEAIEINVVCPKSKFYPLFINDNKIIQ